MHVHAPTGYQPDRLTVGLLLAVKPPEAAARALYATGMGLRALNRMSGQVTSWDRLHATVITFPLPASPKRFAAAVDRAMQRVAMPPFVMMLDRAISFHNPDRKPLVLMGGDGVVGLSMLHDEIFMALKWEGVALGETQSFTPHLTLLRDRSMIEETPLAPISFPIDEVQLIYSVIERREHIVLNRWRLKPPH